MAVESMLEDVQQHRSRRRLVIMILLVVVALHVGAGLVAGIFVVARYLMPPPAAFEVQRDIRLPAQERQHRMNMAEFDALTPKPSFNDTLQSLRPTDFALPDLPKIPLDDMLPLDPSAIVADQVASLVGTAAIGAGTGAGGAGEGGAASGVSFLGIETNARRILLLYDISTTVTNAVARAGLSMERIRDETKTLLAGLGINTRFGLGQFARNYAFFEDELLPATDANRERAGEWLDRWFVTEGAMARGTPGMVTGSPGFVEVLRAAFAKKPDVIFVISDGSFYAGGATGGKIPPETIDDALRDLQKTVDEPVQINFIGVGMKPDDERGMRRVLAKYANGGRFRELKK